jgi:Holliday junction resolvase YEN1
MWRGEANIAKIAQCCEQYFEWGYKEMIIKRFRTFLWGGVCMRVLRQAVMDSDEKEVDAHNGLSGRRWR